MGPSALDHATPDSLAGHDRRTDYISRFGFGVPSREAIAALKAFAGRRTLHEVGAGCGLWACLLSHAGVRVLATDSFSDVTNCAVGGTVTGRRPIFYFPVAQATARDAAAAASPHSILLTVWPPYWDQMANEALAAFKGDRFAFVGEGRGNCTGTDELFDRLDADWKVVSTCGVPRWPRIWDRLTLYQRR